MTYKLVLKIFIGIVGLALLSLIMMRVVVEPLILRKIQSAVNENNKDFNVKIGKVHLAILNSELELENITVSTKPEQNGIQDINGEVASIKLEGIHLVKAIFKNDIEISEVTVFNSSIKGSIPFPEKAMPPKISSINIRIDSLFLDKTNLKIKNTSTAQAFSAKDGVLKVYHLQVQKLDTVSASIVKQFDFNVQEFQSVSADSMYTQTATGINYSATSNKLMVDSFSIHPNYGESEFMTRHKFETDRFEAGFRNISFHNFSAEDYLKSGNLESSYVEIVKMNLSAFRDKRKKFNHVNKPTFQDMIYNYPGSIRIDSIGILNGTIVYTEHAEKANESGWISFQEINAQIYKITNDTIYKTEEAFLELNAEVLLMGKGKLNIALKGRIFDRQNAFSVNGTLSGMEVKELNPMLEKNAFVYATAGKIDAMNFSFLANNTKATGQMTLRYHGLDVAVKNKRTDDTTAIKEQFMSIIANKKLLDSNPIPGEPVRVGMIDYERDPERFLFNYSFKSILSGIKSSLVKESKKGKE
ncbi:MAG: hypothetical protein WC384_18365 [Prolixibacteraceae bacterium]|jgi:hypothetical protein